MKALVLVATLAACSGGSKSSKPITPANPDPVPMTEPAHDHADGGHDHPTQPETPPDPAKPDPAKVKADLLAAEMAAYEKAKPVFEANCARCHSKDGKMTATKKREHFDMTTYPFGGHHAMELGKQIRKSLGIDGSKPTMPFDKKGSVKGEDLELIKKWTEAFDAAHAGGAHEDHAGHGEHDH